ncbi:MAG: CBS domain-containing protein [Dehalococcoidia bacterium]|jgi:CBS domain containing-hemolysin-like protein|nr:CBS domain-containing protein [Dehalococcoidia bacterium]
MDYFLFLLISIFSIIFYIFINYSLSILGYRTFGLNNEESDSSNQTDEKPLEQSSTRLSYEAYILAIFIRNLIICIGLSSFILFLNQTGLFNDLMNTNLISLSILYFLILVLSIVITNKIFSILNNKLFFLATFIGKFLEFFASIPKFNKFIRYIGLPTSNESNDDDKATATLIETLDLLESDQIPAHQEDLMMIRGILRMDDLRVSEIMKPRPDIVAASIDEPINSIIEKMTVGGYSKIPIYNSDLDSILGILFARDILALETDKIDKKTINNLIRQPIYIPESQNLETLLKEFQTHNISIGIVLDEHGTVSGLVTVIDLIEEIIGELSDEFDVDPPEIQEVRQGIFMLDATLSIDQINRKLNLKIDSEGISTIGGFIYSQLGRIPSNGDVVETSDSFITVRSVVGRRIRRVSLALK